MRLSVIIPCKDEVGVVEHLLDSLAAQTTPPYEVIVVDSNSSDDLSGTVKHYAKKLPIHLITATKKGVIYARNQGAEAATGDTLLFLDADVTLPRDFITKTITQMERRSIDVAGFYQRMQSPKASIRSGARLMNGYVRLMSASKTPVVFSCMAATKAAHSAINGFDPAVWIMEDYDYAYRAKRHGLKFGVIKKTFFLASDRRFQDNAGMSIAQGIYAELYRYTHGLRITKPLYEYKMGGASKKKRASESSSQ